MSGPRDLESEMRNLLLDRGTADRLLSGVMAPDDAPQGYAEVAGLLLSCARLPSPDRAHEEATIVAMTQRIRTRPPANPSASGRVAARRPARLRFVAVAIGATLVGTSGLAFAGELPEPAQRIAHTVFASVGLDIPTADERSTEGGPSGSVRPNSSEGPSAGTQGDVISDIARYHEGTGRENGAAVSSEASSGHSQAGQPHGRSGQPHGHSGGSNGRSNQPHGKADAPHGQSAEPHGQSDAEHPG